MNEKEFMLLIDDICGVEQGTVTCSDSLGNGVLFDSLAMLKLIAFLDKEFGVNFGIEELGKISTIGDLFNKAITKA